MPVQPFSQALCSKNADAGVIWHLSRGGFWLEECEMIERGRAWTDKNIPPCEFLLEVRHPGELQKIKYQIQISWNI